MSNNIPVAAWISNKLKLNLFLHSKVKSLGAGDSDDDDDSAMSWVNKSRKTEREKALAEKRVSLCMSFGDQL